MGLIDFVKSAGEKIFGGDEPKPAAAPAAAEAPDPAEVKRQRDRRIGLGLVKMVENLGLGVEDLSVRVDGSLARVSGKVPTQEIREKIVLVVGNTAGIAQVDDQMEVADPAAEATFYTVKTGDTLSKIAKEHYGDAMKYPVIFEANKPMLTDPNLIYPGQTLRIPPLG